MTMSATGSNSGPYCGVYCVYAALRMNGINAKFLDLLDPHYVGSHRGSTLQELRAAAEAHGLYAKPLMHLTVEELRHSSHTIILNVKSVPWAEHFDHYVLYVGQNDGNALLMDSPSVVRVPFSRLASNWSGVALILSPEPISLCRMYATSAARLGGIIVIALAAALILRLTTRKVMTRPLRSAKQLALRSVWQVFFISALGTALGIMWHRGYEGGLLANRQGSDGVALAHLMDHIDKVDVKHVAELLQTHTIFVDARFPHDYQRGHIRGAVNVPPVFEDTERAKAMTGIAKNRRVVVYCANAQLAYTRYVALNLARDGFTNLAVFKTGWSAYERSEKHSGVSK